MLISDFEKTNHTLKAPPGQDDDVKEMPIMVGRQQLPSGEAALSLVSRWTPTPEEREAIADGADIYLHCLSKQHPPVMLSTDIHADRMHVEKQMPTGSTGNGHEDG